MKKGRKGVDYRGSKRQAKGKQEKDAKKASAKVSVSLKKGKIPKKSRAVHKRLLEKLSKSEGEGPRGGLSKAEPTVKEARLEELLKSICLEEITRLGQEG